MNKAIELLQEAKTAKHPAAVLEKAKKHVESTEPGDRGGRRYVAINKIEKAIAAVNKGNDAGALIDEAIVALQEGVEIKKENKGSSKSPSTKNPSANTDVAPFSKVTFFTASEERVSYC